MKPRIWQKSLLALWLILFAGWATAQPPRLEIHHIGVGDGDATFIIAIDTTATGYIDTVTVLIDGNRSNGAGNAIWSYVHEKITALNPAFRHLDFMILSHQHLDHYGGMIAFADNLNRNGWRAGVLIDRVGMEKFYSAKFSIVSGNSLDGTSHDGVKFIDCVGDIDFIEYSSTAQKYVQITSAPPWQRGVIVPGQDLFADKHFRNISMTCLAAMGIPAPTAAGRFDPFLRNTGDSYVPYNDNDLSLVFNLGFSAFNFFTGGDIGGGAPYADGETPVARYLNSRFGDAFHYCGLKVSHHGSEHSTNAAFLDILKPTMAVIQANLRKYGNGALPREATIRNLLTKMPWGNIKYCFVPKNEGNQSSYWTPGNRQSYQDIVLRITGLPVLGNNVQIQVAAQLRNNETLERTGHPVLSDLTCTQTHRSTFKPRE